MSKTVELARHLEKLHINNMYKTDFYWTWDKTDDEIDAVFTVADALRDLRERNKSTKIFNSGLGISLFRDNSTRTRFSFASACNFLGLEEQVLDEKKSQIAHGETVRETANMVSFMADVIGIRDDMYIHQGHEYQKTFMDALEEGYRDGILEQRPTLVNLQCDVDHPTQCMADMLHVIHYFGGVENLKGKKVAMTWAYSPSYGKPLSVPQGVIGLFTRFGMDVTLAHPEGYEVMPEVEDDNEVEIKDDDIRIDIYHSGGAGGQNVNKVASAVRITHYPTGIVVQCQNERSQLQNKEMCFKMLRSKLLEKKIEERQAEADAMKGDVKKIEWGSQIRSYVFMPYTLAKDTRTGYESGNIQSVMDGDIDGFIYAYLKASSRGELQDV